MLNPINGIEGILGQNRLGGGNAGGAQGGAPQGRDALSHHIHIPFQFPSQLIKQLVKLQKIHALDIPVGLLSLGFQV